MPKKIVWPDYENCLANVPNSFLKKFGCDTVGKTLPLLDKYLEKDYKNVVILLLDGMGKSIIDRHLEADGPFRSHLAGVYNSVFLSTTVAATTSAMSGLQPCEHSWLGWDCYYPQIDKIVTVFLNTVQGTEQQAADYNVAETYTPYESIVKKINNAGGKAFGVAPFLPPNPNCIEAVCAGIKSLCKKPDKKFVYAYWHNPDGTLHENGCESDAVRKDLRHIEQVVAETVAELEDTLFVITADHGHTDTDSVYIWDYPKIYECLERLPALEPRVLNFFIKDGMKETFEKEFKKEFGDKFLLMPMEEVIERKLFGTGTPHENFRSMLGDYLAIATDNLSIFSVDEHLLSMHGSITEEEMKIPLIVFDSFSIVKLSEHPELKDKAAEWYSSKWGIPKEAYLESIEESFNSDVPSWYLCFDGKTIVGGMGVIENDFHDRKDLRPNVCAVYTEEEYRGRGIAGQLLNYVCEDMASKGIETLYLLTDHVGFYERYGWEYLCMAQGDGDDEPSRVYCHKAGKQQL